MATGLHCYLDRFEGDLAVLLVGDQEKVITSSLLPRDAREGDHILLSITLDHEARNNTAGEITDLQHDLDTGDSSA